MENVLIREEIVLNGVEAENEFLDFVEECENIGYEMFIEEKECKDTFATINDLFDLWGWLGVDINDLEQGRLDFINISYISADNEIEVNLKVGGKNRKFVIGVL